MNFFIVDDTATIRGMLSNIIEEENVGTVVGEAADGSEIDAHTLARKGIDILIIDLLMPIRDGIETVREIAPFFKGKIIMISQVETKDMISEAYSLGVDHYITKPINRLEVVSVIKKVSDYLMLEKSLQTIQQSLSILSKNTTSTQNSHKQFSFHTSAKKILLELGMVGKSGEKDLLSLLEHIQQWEQEGNRDSLNLKRLYEQVAKTRLDSFVTQQELIKESKAVEQRVRRAIQQVLEHLASLGLTDYANSTFEYYSSKLFDYTQVRMKMLELEGKKPAAPSRIDIRKFLQALHMEAKLH